MVYNADELVISGESHGPMTTRGQKYYQSNDEIVGSSHLRPQTRVPGHPAAAAAAAGSDSDEFDSARLCL